MIWNASGELVVLEINTLPGMTDTSFIPAQLRAAKLSLADFVGSMSEKYRG
jgi:D-alanine-D-alanine ligase-like ATP-grasp enzyme